MIDLLESTVGHEMSMRLPENFHSHLLEQQADECKTHENFGLAKITGFTTVRTCSMTVLIEIIDVLYSDANVLWLQIFAAFRYCKTFCIYLHNVVFNYMYIHIYLPHACSKGSSVVYGMHQVSIILKSNYFLVPA